MSKLYFKYGSMKCGKTLQLISIKTSYERQNKSVFCAKSSIDTRDGQDMIKSRLLDTPEWADMLIYPETHYAEILEKSIGEKRSHCVLVDEGQFLTENNVNSLRKLTDYVPVIVFALRTDFMGKFFDGSKRLFEVADKIEEIKNICYKCNRKATMNLRKNPTGPSILLGDEEYEPACWNCWTKYMKEHGCNI